MNIDRVADMLAARDASTWETPIQDPEFRKRRTREAPVFANINLLGRCNVDCYFCLGKDLDNIFGAREDTRTHFSKWARFEEFLAGIRSAGIQRVYVTGQNTDALLYRHLSELIDYLQASGLSTGFRTNGYLFNRPENLAIAQQTRRNVGVSIHTLDPETNWTIMRRRDIPDWRVILPQIPRLRVSVVLGRHNEGQFWSLMEFLVEFPNIAYVQVRRICTDTREAFLRPDVGAYERVFQEVSAKHPVVARFYDAEVFNLLGKEVCFWRTVKTAIGSWNYYTDGTVNKGYFVIEGYAQETLACMFPADPLVKVIPLSGYWRERYKP